MAQRAVRPSRLFILGSPLTPGICFSSPPPHVLPLRSLRRAPARVVPWLCLGLEGARERLGQAQGLADRFTGAVECFTPCPLGTCH